MGNKNRPNRLFQSLIGISLVIHFFIFLYVAGFYDTKAFTYLEMTLEDISKPFGRDIPRPRFRPKDTPKPRDIKKLEIKKQVMPRFKPIQVAAVNNAASGISEQVSNAGLMDGAGLDLAGWDPGAMAGMKEILTRKDYFDLIQLRIESNKEYPKMAKLKRIEGRTTVEFTISLNGRVSNVKVVNTSRNRSLDDAALDAVQKSSPFPKPPQKLFSGPITIEVAVVFETT